MSLAFGAEREALAAHGARERLRRFVPLAMVAHGPGSGEGRSAFWAHVVATVRMPGFVRSQGGLLRETALAYFAFVGSDSSVQPFVGCLESYFELN